jgi:hypothetical protein
MTRGNGYTTITLLYIVGYGDVVPVTHLGRLACIFACIWGVFIYSCFIISMDVLISFQSNEKRVYERMMRDEGIVSLESAAAKTIANFIMFTHTRNKK